MVWDSTSMAIFRDCSETKLSFCNRAGKEGTEWNIYEERPTKQNAGVCVGDKEVARTVPTFQARADW